MVSSANLAIVPFLRHTIWSVHIDCLALISGNDTTSQETLVFSVQISRFICATAQRRRVRRVLFLLLQITAHTHIHFLASWKCQLLQTRSFQLFYIFFFSNKLYDK